MSRGRLLHPQPEDALCNGESEPLNMVLIPVYWQLPLMSRGRLLYPQPEDASRRGDRAPFKLCTTDAETCPAVATCN
jgi:hypothetical protein